MPTPIVVRENTGSDAVTLEAWRGDELVGSVLLQWLPTDYPRILELTPHLPLLSNLDSGDEQASAALLSHAEDLVYERGRKVLQLLVAPAESYPGYVDWEYGPVDGWEVLVKTVTPGLPGLDAWEAWTPGQVAQLLSGCTVPWCVAAGWAIELHLGYPSRPHSDLEIAVPRVSFGGLAAYLEKFDLHVVGDHQTWVCEQGKWRMDVFSEPGDETTWISHRDDRVRVPLADAIAHTVDGIPYLRPELVLFTKVKHARPKDEADLLATVPTLDSRARGWLVEQIQLVYPGHPWLDHL